MRIRLQLHQIKKTKVLPLTREFKVPEISDPNSNLATKGFLFVENFLDETSYLRLIAAWPKKRWFEPLEFRSNGKSYDSGLRWNIAKNKFDNSITNNPEIQSAYEMLRSEKFCENLTLLVNDNVTREGYSSLLTQSYSHSYLTPHKDSMGLDNARNESIINIIYFVQANGRGWEAGGTSILGDATFKKPIFVPSCLNNTALIYRGAADLWHGFPRMSRGKYRKTILSAYWSK